MSLIVRFQRFLRVAALVIASPLLSQEVEPTAQASGPILIRGQGASVPAASLEGLVTAAAGKRLEEARVELRSLTSPSAQEPAETVSSARLNSDGAFVLEVPTVGVWQVVAEAPGYVSVGLHPLAVAENRVLPPVTLLPTGSDIDELRAIARNGWRVTAFEQHPSPGMSLALASVNARTTGLLRVAGRVLDATSRRPIVGALVWSGGAPGKHARTDRQGSYDLGVPTGTRSWVQAEAEGYLPRATWVQSSAEQPAPTLALEPAATVGGTVADRDGRPVAGAVIEAVRLMPTSRPQSFSKDRAFSRGLSDATGQFILRGLDPDGSYEVTLAKRGFGSVRVTVNGLRDRQPSQALTVVLPVARRAYGRVVNLDQQPISEVEVSLQPAGSKTRSLQMGDAPSVRTDAAGRFEFKSLPSVVLDLVARKPGYAAMTVRGVQAPEGDQPADLGTLTLVSGLKIDGTVIDESGESIADAAVWILEDLGRTGRPSVKRLQKRDPQAITGPEGRFQIVDLEPGPQWQLLVDAEGFLPNWVMGVEAPTAKPVGVTLAPASRIHGEVVDADGAPVARAEVRLEPQAPPPGTMGVVLPRPEYRRSVLASGDGSFELEKVAPGKMELTVKAEGFQPSRPIPLNVSPRRRLDALRIILARGALLEGSVVDGQGSPVVGARLRAEGTSTTTDGDGLFRLTGLNPGKQLLTVEHPEHNRLRREIDVKPEGSSVNLTLEDGLPVAGWVVDEAGRELAGARLKLQLLGGVPREYQAMTTSDGHFRFDAVSSGVYRLMADKQGFAPLRQEDKLTVEEPIDDLEVELRRGARIGGRLLGLSSDEVSTARVIAERDDLTTRHGRVDYRGHYEFVDLEPGDWRLHAAVQGGKRQTEAWVALEVGVPRLERDLEFGDGSSLSGLVTYGEEPLAESLISVTAYERGVRRSVRSDYRGIYRFEDLPSGRFRLSVTHPRELVLHNQDIRLEGDRELDIEIATGRISGFVISGADGEPLSKVQIILEQLMTLDGAQGSVISLTTDGEGIFTAARVSAGRHRLIARKSGYVPLERDLEMPVGSDLEDVELALTPTRGLNLSLRTASGRVPQRANIHVFDAAGQQVLRESRRPTPRGLFPFATVPPGEWSVMVSAPGSVSQWITARVPAEGAQQLILEEATLVTIRVPSLMESNLLASLRLSGPDGRLFQGVDPRGILLHEWQLTGGRATLDGVAAGQWAVEVVAVDGRSWAGSLSAPGGGQVEVSLE